MTQAFNLSQLANNVNTSGQLNAAAGLYNQVPVANGGTGQSSFTGNAAIITDAAGTALSAVAAGALGNVLTSNGTTWISQTSSGGTPVVYIYTSPAPWTKPATIKAVKVTVVSGGGGGGSRTPGSANNGAGGSGAVAFGYFQSPAIAGPVTVTVGTGGPGGLAVSGTAGGPSSFGPLISCTGGSGGVVPTGTGGAGGTMTPSPAIYGLNGTQGGGSAVNTGNSLLSGANPSATLGVGGSTGFGFGRGGAISSGITAGQPGNGYGAGGSAGATVGIAAGNGANGIVIVEEFY